jgi:hypothetical protein
MLGLGGEEAIQQVDKLLDSGEFESAFKVASENECCKEVHEMMQMYLFAASLAYKQAQL